MEQSSFSQDFAKLIENILTTEKETSTHIKILEGLKDIAPDIDEYIGEFVYGDVYSRTGLDNKQRALVTISSLATQGIEPQLELHLNMGLTIGLTPTEIIECIVHLIPYTGFPQVINALTVAERVFVQRNVSIKKI
ncbi:carboxymuconolactone decarboxylase family protein [Bacillus cereus]|uniref:carboxymuconolactone decarboxylase family protein n=1 Tax=Bacillus cereus TaxID=1396 RepID=UPI000C28ED18|nr:carboxymuconolactone decarboxylase family protein [Bacillus cereus]